MACRVCRGCKLSFPNQSDHACPICGGDTTYIQSGRPDEDWELAVEYGRANFPAVTESGLRAWRRKQLEALGFSGAILDLLVEGADVHLAADLVERGCPLDAAARILL